METKAETPVVVRITLRPIGPPSTPVSVTLVPLKTPWAGASGMVRFVA